MIRIIYIQKSYYHRIITNNQINFILLCHYNYYLFLINIFHHVWHYFRLMSANKEHIQFIALSCSVMPVNAFNIFIYERSILLHKQTTSLFIQATPGGSWTGTFTFVPHWHPTWNKKSFFKIYYLLLSSPKCYLLPLGFVLPLER